MVKWDRKLICLIYIYIIYIEQIEKRQTKHGFNYFWCIYFII